MTREGMINKINDYCEWKQNCKGCILDKICFTSDGCAVSKWKDEKLKQAVDKIKEEENEYGKKNHG